MKKAKWKGFYLDKNFCSIESHGKPSRSSIIVPKYIGKTFEVHNGKLFKKIEIVKEMVGHKFGEFHSTRQRFEYKKKKKKKT